MTAPLRVLFVASHPPDLAPGQRFRFEQWLRLLPSEAVNYELRALFPKRVFDHLYLKGRTPTKAIETTLAAARRLGDIQRAGKFDVVFLFRSAFPLGPPLIETLLSSRAPVVYDFDDAIFVGDTSAANSIVAKWKQPEQVAKIISAAKVTTVGNEWLAEYARRHSTNVRILPTTIDVAEYAFGHRRSKDLVTVGWSGSRTTSAHLQTVEPALRQMLEELPVELLVIGDPDFALPGAPRVTVLPWRAATELRDLDRIDIGLMPLPDDDWSRGKCGLKALQYMAVGAAPIVSPVGVNAEIIDHGVNGLIARTQEEWVGGVRRLTEDCSERDRMAAAARRTVEDRYSGQRWAGTFYDILQEAAACRS